MNLPNNVRNAACDAVVDLIDVGSGTAKIIIGTTGLATTLVENNFAATAFGAAAAGVATANTIADGISSNTGTAAEAKIVDKDGNDVITGLTVGLSGTDLVISQTNVTSGDTIKYTGLTVTMPAS